VFFYYSTFSFAINFFHFFSKSQDKDEEAIVAKLLLLYYLLIFEEKKRETFQTVKHSAKIMKFETNFIKNYSNEIYDNISIKYLLLKAKEESDYFILYPSLLRITINFFPQLCQVDHYLCERQSSKIQIKNFDYFVDIIVSSLPELCSFLFQLQVNNLCLSIQVGSF
jgi:hypothetical protein